MVHSKELTHQVTSIAQGIFVTWCFDFAYYNHMTLNTTLFIIQIPYPHSPIILTATGSIVIHNNLLLMFTWYQKNFLIFYLYRPTVN